MVSITTFYVPATHLQARSRSYRGHASAITSLKIWGNMVVSASAHNGVMLLWQIKKPAESFDRLSEPASDRDRTAASTPAAEP